MLATRRAGWEPGMARPGGDVAHEETDGPGGPRGRGGPGDRLRPAAVGPPESVRLAVRLMYVGAALSPLELVAAVLAQDEGLEVGQSITRSLVGVALWWWMAASNAAGKPWARVVGTLFGVVALIGVTGAIVLVTGGTSSPWILLPSVPAGALAIAILSLLHRAESDHWYATYDSR